MLPALKEITKEELLISTKIALILEYDGTNYHGSQFQTNAKTIQGELEKALRKLTGENLRIKAASRTDAGVHASGQVISFRTASSLPLKAFINGMNHHLPEDIAVKEAFRVSDNLDVRRHAVAREYKYYILNSETRSPVKQAFSSRIPGKLNVSAMNRACQTLTGRHDFSSFAFAADLAGKNPVRNVYQSEVTMDREMIVFQMTANSFLPHQVRNTVGSLVKVGQEKMTAEEFYRMVESPQPGSAGPTAPACGLCLTKIDYPSPLSEMN
jgi:tRNA pseudouridine38-40 synthase